MKLRHFLQFKDFSRKLGASADYAPLRELIRLYMLRRLKSEVLKDLPPKTEVVA